ncbi:uncharacterized protein LOC132722819 [Ruditapes philippinarum]|uniref:uncharacterized protein LOC132722819 n=1 Tax=Ruditapes philippinarum TaxID=129788 RepID=UPI00295B00DC|nr:uncharacterized protein LOC132722819 [Ruditapes philippinarum]
MHDNDWKVITSDMCILVSRVLTDFFPWLNFAKSAVSNEIQGGTPLKMKLKNTVIPLQIQHKIEQKYADVVDILDTYQDLGETLYQGSGLQVPQIHIGGDQLTRERFSGAKRLRAAALTASERFENLSPITFELFHLQMTVLATFYDILYKADCTEPFTLYSQKVRLLRKHAEGKDVKNHYHSCRDLAVSFIRAYIVEATCQYFDLKNTDTAPENLPDPKNMTNNEIKHWMTTFVQPLVLNIVSESRRHISSEDVDVNRTDAVLSYGKVVLELGLIFLELCDIVKSPSRIRLLCHMKYIMLVLKGHKNKSKYALEILRLLCQQFALLSEKTLLPSLGHNRKQRAMKVIFYHLPRLSRISTSRTPAASKMTSSYVATTPITPTTPTRISTSRTPAASKMTSSYVATTLSQLPLLLRGFLPPGHLLPVK